MSIKEIPLRPVNPNNPLIKSYVEAIERGQLAYHVLPSPGGLWRVKQIMSDDQKVFNASSEAIQFAKKKAMENNSEAIIHGEDGRIKERYSYDS
jgi:hypothetical protein